MNRFVAGVGFILGTYYYEFMKDIPDFAEASFRASHLAVAMIFIVWVPRLVGRTRRK